MSMVPDSQKLKRNSLYNSRCGICRRRTVLLRCAAVGRGVGRHDTARRRPVRRGAPARGILRIAPAFDGRRPLQGRRFTASAPQTTKRKGHEEPLRQCPQTDVPPHYCSCTAKSSGVYSCPPPPPRPPSSASVAFHGTSGGVTAPVRGRGRHPRPPRPRPVGRFQTHALHAAPHLQRPLRLGQGFASGSEWHCGGFTRWPVLFGRLSLTAKGRTARRLCDLLCRGVARRGSGMPLVQYGPAAVSARHARDMILVWLFAAAFVCTAFFLGSCPVVIVAARSV